MKINEQKNKVTLSKKEWESIGKKAGWTKIADALDLNDSNHPFIKDQETYKAFWILKNAYQMFWSHAIGSSGDIKTIINDAGKVREAIMNILADQNMMSYWPVSNSKDILSEAQTAATNIWYYGGRGQLDQIDNNSVNIIEQKMTEFQNAINTYGRPSTELSPTLETSPQQ
jgi:hypothetical protein